MSQLQLYPNKESLPAVSRPRRSRIPVPAHANVPYLHPTPSSTKDCPSTPASISLKGPDSVSSETGSGETVPSSFEAEDVGSSTQTLKPQKTKEMDPLEPVAKESFEDSYFSQRVAEKNFPMSHHAPTDTKMDLAQESRPEKNGFLSPPEKSEDPSASKNGSSLATQAASGSRLAQIRRHTSPHPSCDLSGEQGSSSKPDGIERPQMKPFNSFVSSSKRWGFKDYGSSSANPRKFSDTDTSRMKSSIMKLNVQRKKDVIDDDGVLLGNKISEGHQNFVLAYNMLTGIRVAVSMCSGVMPKITDADYKKTRKLTFNMDGSDHTPSSKYDFKFKDYSPEVFRDLRALFGIDPADYLMSITGKYILSELGSPGKSGSFFYYSRDYRFIIKTIHHSEHKQLRRILKDYHQHVKNNPNTLISQFYGLHRLKVNGGMKKVHFIVMNNLFPPHRDVHTKYDLKGSLWGRYTKHGKDDETPKADKTLKDLNWLEDHTKIRFGPDKKSLFLKQLDADVALLKKVNAMDYSLLLGIHDVKKGNSETVAKLSIFEPKTNLKAEVIKTNPRDVDRGVDLPTDVFPGRSKYIFYGHNGGVRATDASNEPLNEIYYLGVIDCLTKYSFKKRLETMWRTLRHSRKTISAVPAGEYGDRFLDFIGEGVTSEKLKVV